MKKIVNLLIIITLLLGLFTLFTFFVAGGVSMCYKIKVTQSIPDSLSIKQDYCRSIIIDGYEFSLLFVNNPPKSLKIEGWRKPSFIFCRQNFTISGTLPENNQYIYVKGTIRYPSSTIFVMLMPYYWLAFVILLVLKIKVVNKIKKSQAKKNSSLNNN